MGFDRMVSIIIDEDFADLSVGSVSSYQLSSTARAKPYYLPYEDMSTDKHLPITTMHVHEYSLDGADKKHVIVDVVTQCLTGLRLVC